MCRDDDRCSGAAVEGAPDSFSGLAVERSRRLVEQDQRRPAEQGARERKLLHLSGRAAVETLFHDLVELELGHELLNVTGGSAAVAVTKAREEEQVRPPRQTLVERALLSERHAGRPAGVDRARFVALDEHVAAGRSQGPRDAAKNRGLARTVGPDERDTLSGADLDTQLLDDGTGPEYAGESVDVEDRTAAGHGQSLSVDSGGRVERMPVRRVTASLGARALVASRAIDRLYRWFDRLRSEIVAAVASDELLDRFNELAYGGAPRYQPESGVFREYLFPFEENALARFFPPPPARVLIGGAGGGREALALARRGYRVVGFEPAGRLVNQLARGRAGLPVEVHIGAYRDLEQLFPDDGTFDAAIFGWVSFSHLRTEEDRLGALRQYARLTSGPVLVSFLALKTEPTQRLARFRRLLPRRADRDPQDIFAMTVGLYHPVDEEEVRDLVQRAGMRILHINFDTRETSWPHVVLARDG